MLLSFILCNFLVRMLKYLLTKSKTFFCPQNVEKTTTWKLFAEIRYFFFLEGTLEKIKTNVLNSKFDTSKSMSYQEHKNR